MSERDDFKREERRDNEQEAWAAAYIAMDTLRTINRELMDRNGDLKDQLDETRKALREAMAIMSGAKYVDATAEQWMGWKKLAGKE